MALLPYLHRVIDRENLSEDQARDAMSAILAGEATHSQIAAFLTALRMKGETTLELAGFARAMRAAAEPVRPELNGEVLVDTCGTGGDGAATFNISTIAAFVIAGAGVRVAKHGNRSISSTCGSADLMEALGVNLTMTADQIGRAIRDVGIGFLFAPAIHKAMKHAQPVRLELKFRTVFNMLGPLTNPAGASAQVVGVSSVAAGELLAGALRALGLRRGFVVHGSDGLDEITSTGPTHVWEIRDGEIDQKIIRPSDFDQSTVSVLDLKANGKDENLRIAWEILGGEPSPRRNIVLMNASAALVAAGRAEDFREGVALAARSIDSGAAREKVKQLVEFSRDRLSATPYPRGA